MKRQGFLIERIAGFENLCMAARRARKGKRERGYSARFEYWLETAVIEIRRRLLDGSWRFGPYRRFTVHDTKPRKILAAPFADRVVHHAICAVIEPIFDRGFIHDSWACRTGKGQLAAISRFQHFLRGCPGGWVLRGDIRKYFHTVDHEVLANLLEHRIKDANLMALLRGLIASHPADATFGTGRGMPVGNLTSQLFANVYLDPFDHFCKERLGLARYLRYIDDFAAVDDDRERLVEAMGKMRAFLGETLRLELNPARSMIVPVLCGVEFLGMVVTPERKRLRRSLVKRFTKRDERQRRRVHDGTLKGEKYTEGLVSFRAYARNADAGGLLRAMGME